MPTLSIVPDFLIAVLAAWLGASVVTRTPRDSLARVFGLLTALTALWATSRVVGRLTSDAGVWTAVVGVEAGVASLLPAALLQIVLAFTAGRQTRRVAQRAVVLAAYGAGLVVAILSIFDRQRPITVRPPYRQIGGLPGPLLGWAWIGFRAAVLGLAVWWAWRAWQAAGRDDPRRGQLSAILAAVGCGAVGGLATILGRQLGGPEWPGTTLIAVSLGLVAYAVFVRRVLLVPTVARRSFLYSLGTGLLTAAYVAALLGLERLSRRLLAIDTPLVTAMALVLTIALFDPVRERVRAILDRRSERRDQTYRRLLSAVGDELLSAQEPQAAIEPALARLCRQLGIRTAAIVTPDGRQLALVGAQPPPPALAPLVLPLRGGGREFGQVIFGPRRSRLPYTPAETDLLGDAAAYMAASLQLAERQASQAAALDALTRERAALQSQETALAAALAEVPPPPAANALQVFALGPLRVERGGERIQRWGGAKAGTRQAEAMFAFLFDRAERGVAKDEFLELIWPDVPLDKADLAFHRTLGGLRRIIEPDLKRGADATSIIYHNDRYRLDRGLIGWTDVAAFEERLAAAGAAEPAAAIAALEEARSLYRGEYLDDCPFYGDSEWVEERRGLLRGRQIDLLLALGERYEGVGDRPAAAACFREALRAAGDDCPRADAGLERLGLPV